MNIWQKAQKQFFDKFNMFSGVLRSLRNDPDAWEASIRSFEAQDHRQFPSTGMIVFTGSSSFTLWSTMERDLAPLPVLNRGFGGAKINDVVHYVNRVVTPYHPRAVVLFAGTNDIAPPKPATAQQVFDGYVSFVTHIHATLPETPIYYVAITPSASRWELWPIACEANRLIHEYTRSDSRLRFIDLTDQLLGSDGKPDRSLYRMDRLHPNQKGYVKWTAVIKPRLIRDGLGA
ncbi:MAG: GDSL-type esterase/lipase family protein [Anaerolineales bacterium]